MHHEEQGAKKYRYIGNKADQEAGPGIPIGDLYETGWQTLNAEQKAWVKANAAMEVGAIYREVEAAPAREAKPAAGAATSTRKAGE